MSTRIAPFPHPMDGPPSGSWFFARKKQAQEHALVLQSLGIPHVVQRARDGSWELIVPPQFVPAAEAELDLYDDENVNWPPRREAPPRLSSGRVGALVYALVIGLFFPVGQYGFFGTNIWEPGLLAAGRLTGGEWWRAITALSLHGDLAHLVGNTIAGVAFGLLAAHLLGSGLTWAATILAGAVGNALSAVLHDPAHRAIGASTGVFALIGLQASYEWMRRAGLNLPPMRRWAPIAGAAVLFGYLGTSGENTDVLAHMTGFVSGLGFGVLVAWWRLPERLGPRGQRAAGAFALAVLAIGWIAALTA